VAFLIAGAPVQKPNTTHQRSAPCSQLPESDSLEPGRIKALIVVLVTPATRI